jgi:GNAT superfamily N-acetyltransferase
MMMGLQTHQGGMPGIQLYGSRCIIYTTTPLPRPLFLDGIHSRNNNTLARDNFQARPTNNKVLTEDTKSPRTSSIARSEAPSTENATLPLVPSLAKPKKPFMATAGFPDDIPRFVEIEFAAFRHELINHHLSYRDPSNPAHTARTVDFYKHCMQNIRTSTLPSAPKRHDSKVDLTLTDDDTETATTTEGYRFRKVIDPNTHEIIAFVKSEITTLTPELHASPLDIGHESEPEMNRAWFALNEKVHRDYCGDRQHVCKLPSLPRQILPNPLPFVRPSKHTNSTKTPKTEKQRLIQSTTDFGMLATHPSHQHRGAASSLMIELVEEADALGLEIYCEATNTGRPMYEKYGFIPVKTLRFDPAEYGVLGLGVEVQTVMVRGVMGRPEGVRRVPGFERFEELS